MKAIIRASQSDLWLATIFSAQAVAKDGVVRRSVAWIEREVGRDRFVDEVMTRGFHLLECVVASLLSSVTKAAYELSAEANFSAKN